MRSRSFFATLLTAFLSLAALAAAAPRHPAFELVALGVLGGDVDTNLSCYLLGVPGAPPRVMVDGGSVIGGLIKWQEDAGRLPRDASWSRRTQAALDALGPVEAALFTHAHMDHVGGFIQKTTLDLLLAFKGRKPLDVVGLPVTIAALRDFALKPPLWVDFTRLPPDNPALKLAPLEPGTWRETGPFQVQAIPVNHPDGGAAFLFTVKDDAYLHVGDTGRCAELWRAVRPVFRRGKLRAITLEVSWPSAQEKLAVQTGHLTPPSFLLELNELANVVKDPPPAEDMPLERAVELARALAPAFRDCPILVTHIKAADHDKTATELDALRAAGLNLIIPHQGRTYRF